MLLTEVTTPAVGSAFEAVLYAAVSLMCIVGGGGIVGLLRGRHQRAKERAKQAVREDKLDQVIECVLDPETGFDSHTRQLADITAKVSRNGGKSGSVGDIASRVETAVADIKKQVRGVDQSLQRHIGQHDERDEKLSARVRVLESHKEES